jgi:hypothetical protein
LCRCRDEGHARRPFALYEDGDPITCGAMLYLFTGLAIHEDQLNVFGRNRKNVLAVPGHRERGYLLKVTLPTPHDPLGLR